MPNVLIIREELICPPTWFLSYRDLTLYCSTFLRIEIVLESEDDHRCYHWVRRLGGMDFVEDIVRPGSQYGVRLDRVRRYSPTVITDRISPQNCHRLIASIKSLAA